MIGFGAYAKEVKWWKEKSEFIKNMSLLSTGRSLEEGLKHHQEWLKKKG